MAGITRIAITNEVNGSGAYRFKNAKEKQPAANRIYREVFEALGCPLLDGETDLPCAIDDISAAYDRILGIDVILAMINGMKATIQEKFLETTFQTVTIEYYNDPDTQDEGDWFQMKANYYFVGYDRIESNEFQDWVLLDWAAIQRATLQGRIIWKEKPNTKDGARATFMYVPIFEIPRDCIVAQDWGRKRWINKRYLPAKQIRINA